MSWFGWRGAPAPSPPSGWKGLRDAEPYRKPGVLVSRKRRDIYEYPINIPGSRRGRKRWKRTPEERGLTYAELVELGKEKSAAERDPLALYRRMAKPMVEEILHELGLDPPESQLLLLTEEAATVLKNAFDSNLRL